MTLLNVSASQPLLLPAIRTDHLQRRPAAERPVGTRLRSHAATQTDVSELPELRQLHEKVAAASRELAHVSTELRQTESRIRHEMQVEMEARMKLHTQKFNEKMAYMRERAESHMASLRASSKVRLDQELQERWRHLQDEVEAQQAKVDELEALNSAVAQELRSVQALALNCMYRTSITLNPHLDSQHRICQSSSMSPLFS